MALAGVACIVVSVRLSMADALARRPGLPSVTRAVELAPGSARYLLRQAALLEREPVAGGETAVGHVLERATSVEPLLAEPWMQLALFEEMHGQSGQAERALRHAAEIDHTFKPAWTLANFYARHAAGDPFWTSARHCLQLSEPMAYAPEPVFDLCWRVSDDPAEILRRAVPPSPWVRASYVAYLAESKRAVPALDAWRTLDRATQAAPAGPSPALCDLLLASGEVKRAVEVWNGYAGTRFGQLLDPQQGRSLTGGNLDREPTGRGFDWTLPRSNGIHNRYLADEKEVRIDFDGDQPENAELLTQNIPVVPGARYRLRFQYQTTGIAPGSDIAWAPVDAATNVVGKSTCGSLASAEPVAGECEFQAGPAQDLVRLALRYSRTLGTLRARGTLRISQVRLERLA